LSQTAPSRAIEYARASTNSPPPSQDILKNKTFNELQEGIGWDSRSSLKMHMKKQLPCVLTSQDNS